MQRMSFETLSEDEAIMEFSPKYLHLDPPVPTRFTIIPNTLTRAYYSQPQYLPAEDTATLHRNPYQQNHYENNYNEFRQQVPPMEMAYNTDYRVQNGNDFKERDPFPMNSPRNSFDNYDDFKPPESKRFMYCCIPVNRRSRTICLSITATLLIIIGILIFLFFPRMPTFKVLGFIDDTKGGIKYNLEDFDKTKPETLHFTMNMVMNISVVNSNYYTLKVNKINLKVNFRSNIRRILLLISPR